jgi:predicted ester cyclase
MSAENNKAVIVRIWEGWNRGDLDQLSPQLASAHYFLHSPLLGDIQGDFLTELLKAWKLEKGTFPDYQDKIERVISEGDFVAAFFTFSGTFSNECMGNPPNNRKIVLPWAQLNRFEGDKLAETWNYYDTLNWFRQLNIVVPSGKKNTEEILGGNMKFLTISTFKQEIYVLPEAERNALWSVSIQWIGDLKAKLGDKFRFFSSAGSDNSFSISEFDTYEEYYASLMSPVYLRGLMKYESYPLIEVDEKMLKTYRDLLTSSR